MCMREALKQLGMAKRYTFMGIFAGVGYKTVYLNHYLPTLIFSPVVCQGRLVAGHL